MKTPLTRMTRAALVATLMSSLLSVVFLAGPVAAYNGSNCDANGSSYSQATWWVSPSPTNSTTNTLNWVGFNCHAALVKFGTGCAYRVGRSDRLL